MKLIITTVSVLGGITLIAVAGPYVLPFLQNRNLWAALSLIAILLFTSGHMFNHIRKVPYISGDGKGGISYFAGGFQNQFGLETQIVAAMCKISPNRLTSVTSLADHYPHRRRSRFRNHLSRPQGAQSCRPEDPGYHDPRLGRCHARHVQLPTECLQDEERRLSLLASSFLDVRLFLRWNAQKSSYIVVLI